jgi:cytochrome b subunit of formate dehydrogenase
MTRLEKILIIGIVILAGVVVWQQFHKTEVVYDPMQNPKVIEAFKKDSIIIAQANHDIETLFDATAKSRIMIDELKGKLSASESRVKIRWKANEDKKNAIDTMDEKNLEEDINSKLR